jgi:hypothetical protein
MATSTTLSNPVIKFGIVDLSDQCTSATLTQTIQELQANAFGSTAVAYVGGLQNNTLTLDLYWSTASSETYATLKSLVGTVITTVTIQGSSAATSPTNPIGTLTGSYLPTLPVVYNLGELTTCSITLMGGTFAWAEA